MNQKIKPIIGGQNEGFQIMMTVILSSRMPAGISAIMDQEWYQSLALNKGHDQ
jgi:hypothetical protein